VANNVLAHVPGIDDFVAGFARILKPRGVATFEFPHLLRLVQETQFDTIYHEHFSYLSLTALKPIFDSNGLSLFDVEEIPTHGGSLRLYAQRSDHVSYTVTGAVSAMLERERIAGILQVDYYRNFQARADRIKDDFVEFLIQAKRANKRVGAYGAAAKGNTLLNYSGVRSDLLAWVVDRNPAKQGKYLPGSRIPVVGEDFLRRARPDYVLVLPWNLRRGNHRTARLHSRLGWTIRVRAAVARIAMRIAVTGCKRVSSVDTWSKCSRRARTSAKSS